MAYETYPIHELKDRRAKNEESSTKPKPIQIDEFAFFELTNHFVRVACVCVCVLAWKKSVENSKISFSPHPFGTISTFSICTPCGGSHGVRVWLLARQWWASKINAYFIFLLCSTAISCRPNVQVRISCARKNLFKWKIYFRFSFFGILRGC